MKNARILILRLDTLTPFNDSGHTTYDNDFSTGENTAYIQGCYYATSDAFYVAYYDGNNDIVLSDSVSSDANGVVNSQCYFPTYDGSATPGTRPFAR